VNRVVRSTRVPIAELPSAPEAVGLAAGLNDIGAVSDAVDQGLAHPSVGNHLGPIPRTVDWCGDDHGRLLGPFGGDLEQELGADLGTYPTSSSPIGS
jgi:hypothetical protein